MTLATSALRFWKDSSVSPLSRRGISSFFLIAILLVVLAAGGGAAWLFTRGDKAALNQPILIPVTRGDFVAQVLDQGEVRSSENVEIRCEVRAGGGGGGGGGGSVSVIEVIPEGSFIQNSTDNPKDKDTILVRLDSTSFEKELDQQQLTLNTARTSVIQAEAELKVAEQAKIEYLQGKYEEEKKTIQNEIFNAEQELQLSQDYLKYSTKLQMKGFITKQQLEGDRIAVAKAENARALAMKKLEVLESVTKAKEVIKLQSDIDAATVKYNNEKEKLRIEEEKLAEIKRQIERCTIRPPANVSGQIVYEKEMGRGGSTDWILAEGATVRERQILMRIPNPAKMEVKALINEQSITAIRKGMPASIKVDALHGRTLKGFVTSVSQYAESEGWMSGSIKKFPVLVQIIDPPEELKPGMNGSVAIQTMFEPNVLKVPVQCIYAAGSDRFCLVQRGGTFETVKLEVGGDNSKDVFVKSGLSDGDLVVMNPGNHRELLDLPEQVVDPRIELPEGAIPEEMKNGDGPQGGTEGDGPSMGGLRNGEANRGAGKGPGGEGSGGERGRGGGGGGGGFSPEMMVDRSMERTDKNGDGVLDSSELSEMPEQFRGRIQQADADGDGKISRDELLQSMKRMFQQMQEQGGGMGGPPGAGPPRGPSAEGSGASPNGTPTP